MVYFLYLGAAFKMNANIHFLSNPKKFEDYGHVFSRMVQGYSFFKFWIECFHYSNEEKKEGKKVSHTALQEFHFSEVNDNSG